MDYGRLERAVRREVQPSSRILRKDLRDQNVKSRSSLKPDAKPPWRPAGRIEKPGDEAGIPQENGSPMGSPRGAGAHYFSTSGVIPNPHLSAPTEQPVVTHTTSVPVWDGLCATNLYPSTNPIPLGDRSLMQAGPVTVVGTAGGGKTSVADIKLPNSGLPSNISNRRPAGAITNSVTRGRAPASARQSTLFTANGMELNVATDDLYVRSKAAEAHLAIQDSQARPLADIGGGASVPGTVVLPYESQLLQLQRTLNGAATPSMQGTARARFASTPTAAAATSAPVRGDLRARAEQTLAGPTQLHSQSLLQAAHAAYVSKTQPAQEWHLQAANHSQQHYQSLRAQVSTAAGPASRPGPDSLLRTSHGFVPSGFHNTPGADRAGPVTLRGSGRVAAPAFAKEISSVGCIAGSGVFHRGGSNPRMKTPHRPLAEPTQAVARSSSRPASVPMRGQAQRDNSNPRQTGAAAPAGGQGVTLIPSTRDYQDRGRGGNRPGNLYANARPSRPTDTLLDKAELATMVQQQLQQRRMHSSIPAAPAAQLCIPVPMTDEGQRQVGVSPRLANVSRLGQEQQPTSGLRVELVDPSRTFGTAHWRYDDSPMSVLTDGQQIHSTGGAAPDAATAVDVWTADPYNLSSRRASAAGNGLGHPQHASPTPQVWQTEGHDMARWRLGAPGRLEGLFNEQQANLALLVESTSSFKDQAGISRRQPDESLHEHQPYSPPSKLSSVGFLLAGPNGANGHHAEGHGGQKGAGNLPAHRNLTDEETPQCQRHGPVELVCPPSSCEDTSDDSDTAREALSPEASPVGRHFSYDENMTHQGRSTSARSDTEPLARIRASSAGFCNSLRHTAGADAERCPSAVIYEPVGASVPFAPSTKPSGAPGTGASGLLPRVLRGEMSGNPPPLFSGTPLPSPPSCLGTRYSYEMHGWSRAPDTLVLQPAVQTSFSRSPLQSRSMAGSMMMGYGAHDDEVLLELEIAREAAELEPLRHDNQDFIHPRRSQPAVGMQSQQLPSHQFSSQQQLPQQQLPQQSGLPLQQQLKLTDDGVHSALAALPNRGLTCADSVHISQEQGEGLVSPASSCGSVRTAVRTPYSHDAICMATIHALERAVSPSVPTSCCSATSKPTAVPPAEYQRHNAQSSRPAVSQDSGSTSKAFRDTGPSSSQSSLQVSRLKWTLSAEAHLPRQPVAPEVTYSPHRQVCSLERGAPAHADAYASCHAGQDVDAAAVTAEQRSGGTRETLSPSLDQGCPPALDSGLAEQDVFMVSPAPSRTSPSVSSEFYDEGLAWLESQLPQAGATPYKRNSSGRIRDSSSTNSAASSMHGKANTHKAGEEQTGAAWTLTGCFSGSSMADEISDSPEDPADVLAELLRESIKLPSVNSRSKSGTTAVPHGHLNTDVWTATQDDALRPAEVKLVAASVEQFGEEEEEELSSRYQPLPVPFDYTALGQRPQSPPGLAMLTAAVATCANACVSGGLQQCAGGVSQAARADVSLPVESSCIPSALEATGAGDSVLKAQPARKSPKTVIPHGLVAARCHALGSASSSQALEGSLDNNVAMSQKQIGGMSRTRLQLVPPSPEAVDAYKRQQQQQPVGRLSGHLLDGSDGVPGVVSSSSGSQASIKALGLVAAQRLRFESNVSAARLGPSLIPGRGFPRRWVSNGHSSQGSGGSLHDSTSANGSEHAGADSSESVPASAASSASAKEEPGASASIASSSREKAVHSTFPQLGCRSNTRADRPVIKSSGDVSPASSGGELHHMASFQQASRSALEAGRPQSCLLPNDLMAVFERRHSPAASSASSAHSTSSQKSATVHSSPGSSVEPGPASPFPISQVQGNIESPAAGSPTRTHSSERWLSAQGRGATLGRKLAFSGFNSNETEQSTLSPAHTRQHDGAPPTAGPPSGTSGSSPSPSRRQADTVAQEGSLLTLEDSVSSDDGDDWLLAHANKILCQPITPEGPKASEDRENLPGCAGHAGAEVQVFQDGSCTNFAEAPAVPFGAYDTHLLVSTPPLLNDAMRSSNPHAAAGLVDSCVPSFSSYFLEDAPAPFSPPARDDWRSSPKQAVTSPKMATSFTAAAPVTEAPPWSRPLTPTKPEQSQPGAVPSPTLGMTGLPPGIPLLPFASPANSFDGGSQRWPSADRLERTQSGVDALGTPLSPVGQLSPQPGRQSVAGPAVAAHWRACGNWNDQIRTLLWSSPVMRTNWVPPRRAGGTSPLSRPGTPRGGESQGALGFGGGGAGLSRAAGSPWASGEPLPAGSSALAQPPVKPDLDIFNSPLYRASMAAFGLDAQGPNRNGSASQQERKTVSQAVSQVGDGRTVKQNLPDQGEDGSSIPSDALVFGLAAEAPTGVSVPEDGISAVADGPAIGRGSDQGTSVASQAQPSSGCTPPRLSSAESAAKVPTFTLSHHGPHSTSSPTSSIQQSFGFPVIRLGPMDSPAAIRARPSHSGGVGSSIGDDSGSGGRSEGTSAPSSATSSGGSSCSFGDGLSGNGANVSPILGVGFRRRTDSGSSGHAGKENIAQKSVHGLLRPGNGVAAAFANTNTEHRLLQLVPPQPLRANSSCLGVTAYNPEHRGKLGGILSRNYLQPDTGPQFDQRRHLETDVATTPDRKDGAHDGNTAAALHIPASGTLGLRMGTGVTAAMHIIQVCSGLDDVPSTPGHRSAFSPRQVERRLFVDSPSDDGDKMAVKAETAGPSLPSFAFFVSERSPSVGLNPDDRSAEPFSLAASRFAKLTAYKDDDDWADFDGGDEDEDHLELLLPDHTDLDELIAAAEDVAVSWQHVEMEDNMEELASSCGSAPGPATRIARLHDVQELHDSHGEDFVKAGNTGAQACHRLLDGLSFLSPFGSARTPTRKYNGVDVETTATVSHVLGLSASVHVSRVRPLENIPDLLSGTRQRFASDGSHPRAALDASQAGELPAFVEMLRNSATEKLTVVAGPLLPMALGDADAATMFVNGNTSGSGGDGSGSSFSRQATDGDATSLDTVSLTAMLQQRNLMADLQAELMRRHLQGNLCCHTPEPSQNQGESIGGRSRVPAAMVSVGTSPIAAEGRWTPTGKAASKPSVPAPAPPPPPPPPPPQGGKVPAAPPPPPARPDIPPKGFKRVTPSREQRLRLKQLHWDKVQRPEPGSIWDLVQKSNPALDVEHKNQLCALFALSENGVNLQRIGASNRPRSTHANGAPGVTAGPPAVVRLLDHSRAHNIGIVLSGTRMDPVTLHDAIMRLDGSRLELEQLRALLRLGPRSEELTEIESYLKGVHPRYPGVSDLASLDTVERFFNEMGRVPWLEQRLSAMAMIKSFDAAAQQVGELVATVQQAVHDVRENAELRALLGYILDVGNTLNEGTVRAGAAGFKLDVLLSLPGIKAGDRTTSLLHFMVSDLLTKVPQLSTLPAQLGPTVRAAANVQLSSVAGIVEELRDGVDLMAGQVQALEELGAQGDTVVGEQQQLADALFLERCRVFLSTARPQCTALEALHAGCVCSLRELAAFFQDDFDPRDPTRQLQQLRDFLLTVEKVITALAAERVKQLRESASWRRGTSSINSSTHTLTAEITSAITSTSEDE